jgi:hypothetical protein
MENYRKNKITGKSIDINWNDDAVYVNDNPMRLKRNVFLKIKVFPPWIGIQSCLIHRLQSVHIKKWKCKYFLAVNESYLTK